MHAAGRVEKQDKVERLLGEAEVHEGLWRAFVQNSKVVFG